MIGFLSGNLGKKDMLRHVNKFIIIALLILNACKNEDVVLQQKREQVFNTSVSVVGKDEYLQVYNKINDSVNNWIQNKLGLYQYFINYQNYNIDSILCFNKQQDKVIGTILLQYIATEIANDDIWYFYGAKVNGEWFFFEGSTMVLLRENYQRDIHKPIPFKKMKLLATKYIYNGYLVKGKQDKWTINNHFFDGFNQKNERFNTYGSCPDCTNEDDFYLYCVQKKWQQK